MLPNAVKRLLQAGRPAIGSWLGLGSPLAAEWLAHQGFDWLAVEQEHGAAELGLTRLMLRAIGTTEIVPLVRVPSKDPAACRRALEAGADGLFVPIVETRDEAEAVVRATSCPPLNAARHGRATLEPLVVLMIETARAIRNVEDILAVPGVDACLVVPGDVSAALGPRPRLDPRPEVFEDALARVFRACRAHGVASGISTRDAEHAARRIEQGWQLVAVASDGAFMARAAADAVRLVREQARAQPLGRGPGTRADEQGLDLDRLLFARFLRRAGGLTDDPPREVAFRQAEPLHAETRDPRAPVLEG